MFFNGNLLWRIKVKNMQQTNKINNFHSKFHLRILFEFCIDVQISRFIHSVQDEIRSRTPTQTNQTSEVHSAVGMLIRTMNTVRMR